METLNKLQTHNCEIPFPAIARCEEPAHLPASLIAGAIQYAEKAEGTGHMIDQEQVFRNLYDIMGWEYDCDMV